jgi:pyruvate/2-oxoglutarate dehydrogenase complex dihydrolipoamide acyltransferase (E2) component
MKLLQEITVPQESVNDQSLIVLELFFKSGDKVEKGALIAELETSKTTVSVEADMNGYVQYFCQAGDDLKVNAIIAKIFDEVPDVTELRIEKKSVAEIPSASPSRVLVEQTIFSAKALQLMASARIEKNAFKGKDFVNAADVKKYLGEDTSQAKVVASPTTRLAAPIFSDDISKVEIKKISSQKNKEIEYLSSVQSAGLVSVINTIVELEGVTDYLNNHLQYFKNSLLPVILYETSRLLQKYPAFNGYFNNGTIAFYKEVHIGFAVDIDKGLKVLKIPNTNSKSIKEIEDEIFKLSTDYIDEKLKTESLIDVTFTVTDLSGEGVFSFSPLINMKNAAILGISSIDSKLNRCLLSLAFDHRVTEGKAAAVFLADLKTRIESYRSQSTDEAYRIQKLSSIKCFKCFKKLSEDIGDVGFAKCINPQGEEAYICQTCLKGF